jgi:cyclic pyranopterin phosphate synthase
MNSDETGPGGLTHLDPEGRAHMVDVTGKPGTRRTARGEGWIRMSPEAFDALQAGRNPKGDPLQVGELAGIMAGKRTGDLIPLCHQLPGASVEVGLNPDPELPGVRVTTTARFTGSTGVEMEALTAATVALLTVYDMLKAVDRTMELGGIRVVAKSGGRSGDWSLNDGG